MEGTNKRPREWYCSWGTNRPRREGRMGVIIAIMAVPFLMATGIYNPKVVHHGYCIAEPGSYNALFCPPNAKPHPRYRMRAKAGA
jgi:hypothetical protein